MDPAVVSQLPPTGFSSQSLGVSRSIVLATPSAEPAPAPYLKDVPQLPDRIALLASRRHLTAAEEALVGKWIKKISREIRKAREQWEAEKADAQLYPN